MYGEENIARVITTINPGLTSFMVHNQLCSNRERGQIETINLSNLLIWMGTLTLV